MRKRLATVLAVGFVALFLLPPAGADTRPSFGQGTPTSQRTPTSLVPTTSGDGQTPTPPTVGSTRPPATTAPTRPRPPSDGGGSSSDGGGRPAATTRPADTTTTTPASGTPVVSFFSPTENARVVGPNVEIQLTVEGFKLVDAGRGIVPGEGHAHILIDRDPFPPGELLPTGQADIVHVGSVPFDARNIPLPPGPHRLVVQLADSSHKAIHDSSPVREVRFTVGTGPGFRGQGTLQPACAEVATGSGMLKLVFPMQGGLLQGTIKSRCDYATEAGACRFVEASDRRVIGSYDDRTKLLDGKVLGKTTRQLMAGSPQQCGAPIQESPAAESPFSAAFVGNQVSGTLGPAQFVVDRNDSVSLADPSDFAVEPTTTSSPSVEDASNAGSSVPVGRIALGIGGAALLAAVVAGPLRRRMSSRAFGGAE